MITFTLQVSEKDWWILAGKAERDGLTTHDLLTRLMVETIRTNVGGKDFDQQIETMWNDGYTDREMSITLNTPLNRIATTRRRLGLNPNKGK